MEVHIQNGITGLEYAIRNARTDLEEQQNKICKTEHEEQEKEKQCTYLKSLIIKFKENIVKLKKDNPE